MTVHCPGVEAWGFRVTFIRLNPSKSLGCRLGPEEEDSRFSMSYFMQIYIYIYVCVYTYIPEKNIYIYII